MRFKEYLDDVHEAIIVPDKIEIKTTDVKKLNKQFKNTIISFSEVDSMDATGASYLPQIGEITVRVYKDMPLNTLEYLIQHEIIHEIQDKKSGDRMALDLVKRGKQIEEIQAKIDYYSDLGEDQKVEALQKKMERLQDNNRYYNVEEYMTYAYAAVKLAKPGDSMNKVQADFELWWGREMTKQMLKYFRSYWMVKNEL